MPKNFMTQKMNLLYIHSDQHTKPVSGCYGDKIVQTPNLDDLAAKGVTFNNAYCASPICVPSRMSNLTGRFPFENDVWMNYDALSSGIPTFAHSMGAVGYNPVLFGRMHSMGPDQLHGYTNRFVGDHSSNYVVSTELSHGELQGTTGPNRVSLEKSGAGQNAYQLHDEDVVSETCKYLSKLGQQQKSNGPSEPFSVTVGLMLPHQPFVASKEDYELYDGKIGLPRLSGDNLDNLHPYLKDWRTNQGILEVTEEEQIRSRTAYYALVTKMDRMIGQILDTLKENGLDKNTMIVYTSDHGEQIGERGLWWKQTFYNDSVEVPLIISYPEGLPQNVQRSEVVSSLDLNATLLDAMQAPALPSSRGRSLMPLMNKETTNWENIAYSEFCLDDGTVQRMVRENQYKYIYYLDYPPQLFDLEEDPDELNDISGKKEVAEIEDHLRSLVLQNWDPEAIRDRIAIKKKDYEIIEPWARNTQPEERYIWDLKPDMDYLDKDYVYKA